MLETTVHLLSLRRASLIDFRYIKSISPRKLVESVLVSQREDSERIRTKLVLVKVFVAAVAVAVAAAESIV